METVKRILILYADIGLGHRRAAQAIAAALAQEYNDEVHVELVNPLNHRASPRLFSGIQTGFDHIAVEWPALNGAAEALCDTAAFSVVARRVYGRTLCAPVREALAAHQPDAVVCTHSVYLAPVAALNRRHAGRRPMISVVTDLRKLHRQWFHPEAYRCLVPNEDAALLARKRGLGREQVVLTGLPIDPALAQPDSDRRAVRRRLGLEPDRFTLLAVGSKRVAGLEGHLRALDQAGLPLQVIAVAGGNGDLQAELQQTGWCNPVRILGFVDNMPELLHAADCVLSKAGGLIVSESLGVGLPLLLIQAIPGKETGNAGYVVQGDAGDFVPAPCLTVAALRRWLAGGGSLYQWRAECARRLGRPRAAFRAAEEIVAAAEHARFSQRKDARVHGRQAIPAS